MLFAGRLGPCWHYGLARTTRNQGEFLVMSLADAFVVDDFNVDIIRIGYVLVL